MKHRWWLGCLVVAFGVVSAGVAKAEEPGAVNKEAARDVVRLKNGGLLRGTIAEMLPGDSVTIVTVTGATRTFKMVEVDYAGPVDKDPQAAPAPPPAAPPKAESPPESPPQQPGSQPYVSVVGQEAQLTLKSEPSGLTFHRQTGTATLVAPRAHIRAEAYERLCTAPCSVKLPAGSEKFALSDERGEPIAAPVVSFPPGPSELSGRIISNSGTRVAGVAVLVGGLVLGGVLEYSAFGKRQVCDSILGCRDEMDLSIPLLTAGIVSVGAGTFIGVALLRTPDEASIAVNPSASARAQLPRSPTLTWNGHF